MNTKLINTFKQLYTDRQTERGCENRKLIKLKIKIKNWSRRMKINNKKLKF